MSELYFMMPLVSTQQKGSTDIESNQGIFWCGLQSVTILIGVYDIQTRLPLQGVITTFWVTWPKNPQLKGHFYWGLSCMWANIHAFQLSIPKRNSYETRSQLTENTHSEVEFSQQVSEITSTIERRLSKSYFNMYVEIAYSRQPRLFTGAFALSKVLLTFTSFQKTPLSSGTLVLLMPYPEIQWGCYI